MKWYKNEYERRKEKQQLEEQKILNIKKCVEKKNEKFVLYNSVYIMKRKCDIDLGFFFSHYKLQLMSSKCVVNLKRKNIYDISFYSYNISCQSYFTEFCLIKDLCSSIGYLSWDL